MTATNMIVSGGMNKLNIICVCAYTYIYVCIYAYTCMCMYICIYIQGLAEVRLECDW